MSTTAVRLQTQNEEIANSVSHGAGAVLAAVFSPHLIGNALAAGTAQGFAAAVYCGSMILLFAVSAAYHWMPVGTTKDMFRRLDHAAIFLFIAGTYTPFMLGALADHGGHTLLIVVWCMATAGIVGKCANRLTHPYLSTALYLGMGWLAVFILQPLLTSIPAEGISLIVAGGVLYTIGAVVFHLEDRFAYGHFVWHLFVLGAAGCHFVAVMLYAA